MPLPLTEMFDKESERGFARTPEGMAHWAGSGPKGKSCRECKHYTNEGRYSQNGKFPGYLKPGRCRKYATFMRRRGPKFPVRTASCKHFEQNPDAPVEQETKYG